LVAGLSLSISARDLLTRGQADLPTAPTAEHEQSLIRFHDICFWIVVFTERFALVLAQRQACLTHDVIDSYFSVLAR
jgi:hypothetical protein